MSKATATGIMPDTPLVSIVMPAYNAEETIVEAVDSIIQQTMPDWELVICDDASTDKTSTILGSIHDDRIRVIRNDVNLGPGPSRDKLISMCTGYWIAFLDADDMFHPRRLSVLTEASPHDDSIIIFDNLVLYRKTPFGMRRWRNLRHRGAFGLHSMLPQDIRPEQWGSARQFLMHPMIPRSSILKFGVRHSSRRFMEDTEFVLKLISHGMGLRYSPEPYYLYRIRPTSLSAIRHSGRVTRQVLEDALPWFADNSTMHEVLQRKIEYRRFTEAISTLRWKSGMGLALSRPGVIFELISRTIGLMADEMSRILQRGARRKRT